MPWTRLTKTGRENVRLSIFALPGVALYLVFMIIPILIGLLYAFTSYDGISAARWTGITNFTDLARDPAFSGALVHTVAFAAVITTGQNVIGLGLAMLLNRSRRLTALLRGAFFLPALLSSAVVAVVWGFIFSPLTGVIQQILGWAGLHWAGGENLLGTPVSALLSVSAVVIWQFSGYVMVIYLAGLKSIPVELYEAAALDGADGIAKFRSVTLPLLRPAMSVALTISIVGNLRLFDPVWLITGGGPGTATETVATQVYRSAFQNGRFGYAAAESVVVIAIIVVAVTIQRSLMRSRTL